MEKSKHIQKHKELHNALDELLADWIHHTGVLPSNQKVGDLMKWSFEQTQNPMEEEEK